MLNTAEYDLKNYMQIKGCYLLRLKAEADDTLQYLHNCSNHMKAESKLACIIDVFLPNITNVFQILSMLAGYKELARSFEPIINGEIFGMNNNVSYGLSCIV